MKNPENWDVVFCPDKQRYFLTFYVFGSGSRTLAVVLVSLEIFFLFSKISSSPHRQLIALTKIVSYVPSALSRLKVTK